GKHRNLHCDDVIVPPGAGLYIGIGAIAPTRQGRRRAVISRPIWPILRNSPENALLSFRSTTMNVLAGKPFVKMNGVGNEIVVVNLQRPSDKPSAVEVRALSQPKGVRFDQLMVLYPARTAGADASVQIYNKDGSESGACGYGMRCVADLVFKATGREALRFETVAGVVSCWKQAKPLT